ncbi:hypothetical protein [Microcoleus asticus]|nr:hypothetical protein [Microcoleus asticus]
MFVWGVSIEFQQDWLQGKSLLPVKCIVRSHLDLGVEGSIA